MKTEHTHEYKKGRGSVDVCSCGRFRHNEKAGPAIVEQRAEPKRTTLSFDGHGVNDYDEYGSRIATLTDRYKESKYGPLFAAAPETAAERDRLKAINAEMLEALRNLLRLGYHQATIPGTDQERFVLAARAAIAKTQGE